ncbi:hypothetical protein JHK82_031784 [Glycine max]|nr:hypothetical protein JHK85_032441 [Glycine max]KAG4995049.1 hypothetical protein JHK86_031876 [Glycine max]KAG5125047.1 hypothetical protein JHK82_031784 [Glycine max]KAG5146473.1 hypothetical protein JHK84_032016 [Glycine max]
MPQPLALVSLLLLHSIHSCVLVEQQTKIASGMEWDNNYDLSGYKEEEGFIFNDSDDAGPLLFPFPVAEDLLQTTPCGAHFNPNNKEHGAPKDEHRHATNCSNFALEASPSEYARANKELRKLSGFMDLIKELKAKQKEIDGLMSLMAECFEDKDMLNTATEEMGQAVEEERRL